jgi:hypothetical protein
LMAIFLALKSFISSITGKKVNNFSDNQCVVRIIYITGVASFVCSRLLWIYLVSV